MKFTRYELENLIRDDIIYYDMTTQTQGIKGAARLEIYTREDIVISALDAAFEIARMFGCEPKSKYKNSDNAGAKSVIFEAEGEYENLHKIYKSIQILLEYSCAIATMANKMQNIAKSENSTILTTRKVFPFAKKLCLKAVLEGGAQVHRTGLDESVLFFANHIRNDGGFDEFYKKLPKYKKQNIEKKLIVEAENLDEAVRLLGLCDCVQCDKFSIEDLEKAYRFKELKYPEKIILASGGIDIENLKNYAKFSDGVVTSAPYQAKPINLGARISGLSKNI